MTRAGENTKILSKTQKLRAHVKAHAQDAVIDANATPMPRQLLSDISIIYLNSSKVNSTLKITACVDLAW